MALLTAHRRYGAVPDSAIVPVADNETGGF